MNGVRPREIWIAVALVLAVSFGIDLYNTVAGGAIDLRNRVTGVRLLERGVDPYTYKWKYEDGPEVCDVYNNPHLPVSKTTASPMLLFLHAPVAVLPYRIGEFAWLFAQWAMLLGTGWLWWRACGEEWQRQAVGIFFAAFTYTAAWRLHAERGQAYVLLALVLAAWMVLTLDRTWGRHWTVGLLAGLLIGLRPTFVVLAPFLALHRRAQLIGLVIGVLVAVGLPMLFQPDGWSHYYAGMQLNSDVYRDGNNPRPGKQHYPAEIEGMSTLLMGKFAVIPYADFSVFALLRAVGVDHDWLGNQAWPAWPIFLAYGVGFVVWLGLTWRRAAEGLLAGIAAWIFLADFFLPAYRNSYNDVLMLDVVAAGIAVAAGVTSAGKIPWGIWPCAAALPVGVLVYLAAPEQVALINLPTALLTVGAVMFVCSRAHKCGED